MDVWDANSNRVSFNANGTEYELVYDPTASIPAVIEESTSGSTVYYIREPSGALIARLNTTDGIRYYHFDELGSTRLLTDADGNITDRYAYDAYGSLLSHDRYPGSVNQPYQYVGRLGYYTHWMEPDFGLLQLGVRFYDAEVGRFGQRDPEGDSVSWYTYADMKPLVLVDPDGRLSICGYTLCTVWSAKFSAVVHFYDAKTMKYLRTIKRSVVTPMDDGCEKQGLIKVIYLGTLSCSYSASWKAPGWVNVGFSCTYSGLPIPNLDKWFRPVVIPIRIDPPKGEKASGTATASVDIDFWLGRTGRGNGGW